MRGGFPLSPVTPLPLSFKERFPPNIPLGGIDRGIFLYLPQGTLRSLDPRGGKKGRNPVYLYAGGESEEEALALRCIPRFKFMFKGV